MAENKCTGDCTKCPFPQQVYCAAQRTYAILNNQESIVARLDALSARLSMFDSMESINPIMKDTAQEGAGAENRAPEHQIIT